MKIKGGPFQLLSLIYIVLYLIGCRTTQGNVGRLQSYSFMVIEAQWIRNGEPIEFEGALWYPRDGIESLMDSEVYMLGDYRGVQYFVDSLDVRPYDRLYTKFGKNKFRYFEKRQEQ
jgi:hypothetical protein